MKKIKILLAVLSAMIMLVGGCLTVCAADSYDTSDINACSAMIAYGKRMNYPSYPYMVFMRNSTTGDISLAYSDKPFCGIKNLMGGTTFCTDSNANYYRLTYINQSPNVAVKPTHSTDGITLWDSNTKMVFYPNHDMVCYYTNGVVSVNWTADTDFFPNPPIAQLAEGLPQAVLAQTKVILTIAVACLALLVILSVLRKKLPIYLNS